MGDAETRDVHAQAMFTTYRGDIANALRAIADRLNADPDLVFHAVHNDGEVLHAVFEEPALTPAVPSPKDGTDV